ncbi:MAG TPA: VWA domain-containing protein [Methanosarcinaceae archaeon]|nr:VWA domain-containing protein [Methanosarcinaceae archaeon]
MDDNAAASRMRRNVKREHTIRVFHIGRPILGVRIPKVDVADFDDKDADAVYDLMRVNMSQMRPDEIKDVFIIADANHLVLKPDVFFKPILQETGSFESVYEDVVDAVSTEVDKQVEVEVFPPDKSEIEPVEPEIEVEIETQVEPKIIEPFESAADMPVEEVHPDEPVEPEIETQVEPEVIEPVESAADVLDEFEEQELPEDLPKKTEEPRTEKLHNALKEDKTVGKILHDFAKSQQSKKIASGRLKSGRRAEVLTKGKRGRYVRYRIPGDKITDIAIAPTVRAAALHAKDGRISIKKADLREKIRRRRISTLINVVFDTSGSMDEQDKIQITTGVVLALLKDAYQRRDRVSLVTYSGRSAELVLPFTSSVEAAKHYLENVPFGGTTPMASGMLVGLDTLIREVKKEPSAVPIMVIVTDGTANVPLNLGGSIKREIVQVCSRIVANKVNALIVDISEDGSVLAMAVSDVCEGKYYHPRSLSKEALYSAIKKERDDKASHSPSF